MAECNAKLLAGLFSMTQRRIEQLAVDGVVVKISHGKYDLFESVRGYAKYQNSLLKTNEQKLSGENVLIKEMKRKEMEGELVDAADVLSVLIEANTTVKARLRSLSAFMPLDIASIYGSTDAVLQRKVQKKIKDSVNDILRELSDWKPTPKKKK